jgi:predicted XRE-type DNA-binding protein
MRKVMITEDTFASVWDAIADTPEQAANMRTRSELMQQIAAIVNEKQWTQVEAAKQCGVTQPRMNDLLRGRVYRFSLDALVNIATAIGRRVHVELEAA